MRLSQTGFLVAISPGRVHRTVCVAAGGASRSILSVGVGFSLVPALSSCAKEDLDMANMPNPRIVLVVIVALVAFVVIRLLDTRRDEASMELPLANAASQPDPSTVSPDTPPLVGTISQPVSERKVGVGNTPGAVHRNVYLVVLNRRNGTPIEGAELRLDLESYNDNIPQSDHDGMIRIPCSHPVGDADFSDDACMAIIGQAGIVSAPGYATASLLILEPETSVFLDHSCSILFVAQHEDGTPAADVGLRITMSGLQALQGIKTSLPGMTDNDVTSFSMGRGTFKLEVDPLMNKTRVVGGAIGQRDAFGTTGPDGSLVLDSLTPDVPLLPIVVDGLHSYKLDEIELVPGERRLEHVLKPRHETVNLRPFMVFHDGWSTTSSTSPTICGI